MLTVNVLSISKSPPLTKLLLRKTSKYTTIAIPHGKCYSKNCRRETNPDFRAWEEKKDEEKVLGGGT